MTTPTPRDFRLFRLADELRELTTPIGKEAATILERQAMTLLQFHADLAAAQEARQAAEARAEQNAKDAERWRHWRRKWATNFIIDVFGGGCIKKTVEMAEAKIDEEMAAIAREPS